ncbi:lysM domain receptor-like kinase 3 [Bidens hawaiensis]|uniref:lysM domain receptor-like kinase 3 n=1 Tax=Bidens hawaiensis TaxID=980011 RepID=UPI00404AF21F
MCGNKPSVKADEPELTRRSRSSRSTAETRSSARSNIHMQPQQDQPSSNNNNITTTSSSTTTYTYYDGGTTTGSSYRLNSSTATAGASVSSKTSLSSLRNSLPENTHIYDINEIRQATNNFLAKRFSAAASVPSWRCNLRGKDVVVFQRKFRRPIQESELRDKLSVIYRSHHVTVIKLVGASISGDYIYLAYDFVSGANLSDCLRNKRNPDFTMLSTWMSRMQIATDLASGLDYIHNNAGLKVNLVHKYVKSSSVIVTEPSFFAKICHFGAAELCGETVLERVGDDEIVEVEAEEMKKLTRSGSRTVLFEGVNGYMAPEFKGLATQKSDVYAFGVVVLELLSGEEPVKYRYDKETGTHVKTLVVETARYAVGGEESETEGRLRRWVDRRLKDSFPVVVAEKLTRIALDCVEEDPNKRPNMSRVSGKISKLYLDSKKWVDTFRVPNDFTSSFAPR